MDKGGNGNSETTTHQARNDNFILSFSMLCGQTCEDPVSIIRVYARERES